VESWYLEGFSDDEKRIWRTVLRPLPFRIGRRPPVDLRLISDRVSNHHAEIYLHDGDLCLRDLGSTNGTFVNGRRLEGDASLREGDIVHFADQEFRLAVDRDAPEEGELSQTVAVGQGELHLSRKLAGYALALEEMMRRRAVRIVFQPVFDLESGEILGYEALGRGAFGELPTHPDDLFAIAESAGREVELSALFRELSFQQAPHLPGHPYLFLNTRPQELTRGGSLIAEVERFREQEPDLPLVLEIHEAAVTDLEGLKDLRSHLASFEVGLAFDDFGTGQGRLVELVDCSPDFVKFDARLIRHLHEADVKRTEMVRTLVRMVLALGIMPVAEGVEVAGEAEACRQVGFRYVQGFHFGRPEPLPR
jgi:EAL domain-containing protein (putative c-di-GMP-specific phosphodiesterase class I)